VGTSRNFSLSASHWYGMDCDRAREAISARIDGEDPGVPDGALEEHLAGCAVCRGWQQRAHTMTRRARLGGPYLDRDLTGQVLAAVPPAPANRRLRLTQRVALLVVALGQLAITVPLLILGHDQGAGTHAAHELGSFDLALAIAYIVGAVRPALSAGLAWPCSIAAAGLVGTAIVDLIGGQTVGADEAQHLIAAVGALLLLWQARTVGPRTADAGAPAVTNWPLAARHSPAPGTASLPEGSPRSPGGDAARLTAPDTAHATPAAALPDAAAVVATAQGQDGTTLSQPGRDGDGKGKEAVA
jgi:predicted anti-sigma-YlaC factor YlaD